MEIYKPAQAATCRDSLEEWQTIEETLRPVFQESLQTFLGNTSLRMEIVHGSGAEM